LTAWGILSQSQKASQAGNHCESQRHAAPSIAAGPGISGRECGSSALSRKGAFYGTRARRHSGV
jgi:hypothetical protein